MKINPEAQHPLLELFIFEVALHVKLDNCPKVFALFKHIDEKKPRVKQRVICCDHVNKCFKYSKINFNKVANNFSFTSESTPNPEII